MPNVKLEQNLTAEERKKAISSQPSGSTLPAQWTCVYSQSFLNEAVQQQTGHLPPVSADLDLWLAKDLRVDDAELTSLEQREIEGLARQPITAEEVEIWEPEQDWGDE